MEKVLVVGGLGFIGKELVSLLGEKAVVLDANASGPGTIKADISNFAELEKIFNENKFSACMNFAAIAFPLDCERQKRGSYLVNVVGNMNLVELCSEHDVDFYYASSVRVYAPGKASHENSPLHPEGVYIKTKCISEKVIGSYYDLGLLKKAVIFRFSNVYGIDSHQDRLIPTLISSLKKGSANLTNADTKFDLVYAKDVAKAVMLAMDKAKGFQIYNVASGRQLSIRQIAQAISKALGNDSSVRVVSGGGPTYPKISIAKIKKLGFKPTPFEAALKEILRFY